jgi:anaphase-promoting complex subunit 2
MNQLGSVKLELQVAEEDDPGSARPVVQKTREFTCSPLLATLILYFEDQPRWFAEGLSNETGVPEHIIHKRMGYWISNRVVRIVPFPSSSKSSKVLYELLSQSAAGAQDSDTILMESSSMLDEDGTGGQAVSATAHETEATEAYESYIVGMLTNLGQLPLERIHNMLKMFVTGSDVRYDKNPQQLSVFLQHLCRQETLECGPDGMYRLFQK